MNWDRLLKHSQIYSFYQWTARRHAPEPGTIYLSQRRVYILPTREGLVFGLALVLMLIGSINYNLALGYVLTFLLAGTGVVAILHTFRNLAHLRVSGGRVDPVFDGDWAMFELKLENRRELIRRSLNLVCGGQTVVCDVPAGRSVAVPVPVRTAGRGWLQLPRVTIATRYPLGLCRAWSYVRPDVRALVYPKPDDSSLPVAQAIPDTGEALYAATGTDDFFGLRPYQPSDSPRQIAWKAAAKSEQLLSKMFSGRASSELWFDWDALSPELGTEARLSRLTRWVLLAAQDGLRFGLRLPGIELPLGEGDAQRQRCLKELALYGRERGEEQAG